MKATVIFYTAIIIGFMSLITFIYIDYQRDSYPNYIERSGNESCNKCFGSNMKSFSGGDNWAVVTCTGDREYLTLWHHQEPEEARCHNKEGQCKSENEFLASDTRWNKSCQDVKSMIDIGYFPTIQTQHKSITCTTNETYNTKGTDTAGCKKCAEEMWRKYYYENCASNLKIPSKEESNG